MSKYTDNILAAYNQATPIEIEQGKAWYWEAHEAASRLHPDTRIATAIVAALSPGLRWERNIEAARRVIVGESLDGIGVRYTANIKKAYRLLHGESVENVLFAGKRSGSKVRAFWACLFNPLDWFNCVIDGHAFGIWNNERIPLDAVPNLDRNGLYSRIATDYTRVADRLGLLPNQIQAITWQTWRRLVGVADGGTGHIN